MSALNPWPMKTMFMLFLAGLMTLTATAQEEHEPKIVASRVHSLYYLLECLIDEPHRSPAQASTFRGRVGNWLPAQQAVDSWRASRESDELANLRFPRSGPRRPILSEVLERVALQSISAEDMAQRVQPWLGLEHGASLARALGILEPLHRQYWWGQSEKLLETRRSELEEQIRRGRWSEALEATLSFYDAKLKEDDPLILALIPYQKGPGETSTVTRGHSQGGLQVMEVVVDQKDSNRAGVAFHEFMHLLWNSQSSSEKERWEEAFHQHGLTGRLAHRQLNEGLATALGNGWFQQRVSGSPDPKAWYFDPIIDAYARELLPIIEPALEEERVATNEELGQMVEAFKIAVPEAETLFDAVAADFSVASSRPEIHGTPFQNEVMRLGPVRSSAANSLDQPGTATFQVYWVQESERALLVPLGWSLQEAQGFQRYHLRLSPEGWKLAFLGEQSDLFELLRGFQRDRLVESRE